MDISINLMENGPETSSVPDFDAETTPLGISAEIEQRQVHDETHNSLLDLRSHIEFTDPALSEHLSSLPEIRDQYLRLRQGLFNAIDGLVETSAGTLIEERLERVVTDMHERLDSQMLRLFELIGLANSSKLQQAFLGLESVPKFRLMPAAEIGDNLGQYNVLFHEISIASDIPEDESSLKDFTLTVFHELIHSLAPPNVRHKDAPLLEGITEYIAEQVTGQISAHYALQNMLGNALEERLRPSDRESATQFWEWYFLGNDDAFARALEEAHVSDENIIKILNSSSLGPLEIYDLTNELREISS